MSSIKIINDAHWHELRKRHIGSTESPALFGLSPWSTKWQLFMEKTGKLPREDIGDRKHVAAGSFFEPGVMAMAAHKWGMQVRKIRRYMISDTCPGMGASGDFEEFGIGRYRPAEIKFPQSYDGWEWDGDEIVMAPDYYVIQIQQEIECASADDGILIAFLGGDVRRAIYPRRQGMIDAIKANVTEFWADVAAGREPPIDFKADADAAMRYATSLPSKRIDWTPEIAALAKVAHEKGLEKTAAEKEAAAAKAELAHRMIADAVAAGANDPEVKVVTEGDGFRISNSFVAENIGQEITAEMIGERLWAKKAYRLITVSRPKPKAAPKPRKKREVDKDAEDRQDYVANSEMGRGDGAQSADMPIQMARREEDE